jgi:hypothetical protein
MTTLWTGETPWWDLAPMRVQRSRRRGARLPLGTMCVTRPGRWGNPFYPGCGRGYGVIDTDGMLYGFDHEPAACVWMFRRHLHNMRLHQPVEYRAFLAPLRGRDLACWCGIGEPCHADILLVLANAPDLMRTEP